MPVVVPVVIAPVNDNSMIQDVSVQIAVGDVQNKVDTAQFSGDNRIL